LKRADPHHRLAAGELVAGRGVGADGCGDPGVAVGTRREQRRQLGVGRAALQQAAGRAGPDSRVDVLETALADVHGLARVGRALASGRLPLHTVRSQLHREPLVPPADLPVTLTRQLVRFGGIGVASPLAFLALFLLMRPTAGAQGANLVALFLTAVANTAANRRLTFGVRGAVARGRHHLQGLVVFGIGLALTSGCLAAVHALLPAPGRAVEVGSLVLANAAVTLLRFLLCGAGSSVASGADLSRPPGRRRCPPGRRASAS